MDEMKEGCRTSGILQDRPKGYSAINMNHCEKGRMTVKEAEVGRSATATTDPGGTVSSLVPKGRAAFLVSPQGRSLSQRLFPKSSGICPARFQTCLRPWPLSSFRFFLLEWECLSYACLTIVIWKQVTCLVSQVCSWRGILPRDESYLQLHPYLS